MILFYYFYKWKESHTKLIYVEWMNPFRIRRLVHHHLLISNDQISYRLIMWLLSFPHCLSFSHSSQKVSLGTQTSILSPRWCPVFTAHPRMPSVNQAKVSLVFQIDTYCLRILSLINARFKIIFECLLFAKYCARFWGYCGKPDWQRFCPYGRWGKEQ